MILSPSALRWLGIALLLTLLHNQHSFAETIPFVYWYGRIVGASRYSLEHVDSRRGLAEYRFSFGVGTLKKYQFYSPDRILYTPHRSSNKLRGSNRGLNFVARTPLHSRYEFTLLNFERSSGNYLSNGYNGLDSRREFSFSHQLQLWSADSLGYDSERSAFIHLSGPWFSARNYHVVLDHRLLRNFSDYDLNIFRTSSSYDLADTGYFDSSDKQTNIGGMITAGLGNGIQMEIEAHIDKLTQFSTMRRQYERDYSDYVDTTISLESNSEDGHDRAGSIQITRLWQPQMWSSLSYEYAHIDRQQKSFRRSTIFDSGDEEMNQKLHIDAAGEYTHEVISTLTWLSRRQQIERQLILDNYNKYYGLELERGTFVFNSELRWYRQRRNFREAEFVDVDNYELSDIRSVRHRYELEIAADLGYYVRSNLSTGAKLRIYRQAQEQSQNYETFFNNKQLNSLTYWLEFRTYRWRADKRREISWDQVSPLDYILGPLLRPLDLRLRLDATPPALEELYDTRTGRAWRFRLGSFNRDWQVTLAGAVGLPHHCEVGSTFSYRYYRSVWTSDALTRYTYQDWDTSLKWQPLRFARLTVLYKWSYSRQADDKYYPRGPLEAGNWTISVKAEYIR